MKLTRFLAKCILAALPFLLVMLFTLFCPLFFMDAEYPSWRYTMRESTTRSEDYDFVILGDSRAMSALMPNEFQGNGVNLAMGGATTIENYYTMKRYLAHHAAPERAVIVFAPFHYSTIDNFRQRTLYFNYLSIAETAEVLHTARTCKSEAVFSDGIYTEALSDRLRLPQVYLPALMNARLIGRYGQNAEALSKLTADRGYAAFGTADGCDDLNYEVHYEDLRESGDSELIALYLKKLIALCLDHGVEVVIAQAPMNEASHAALHENYVKSYGFFMRSISDLYPDCFAEQEIPCYANAYFGDASHLNEKGALKFSRELAEKYGM